MIDLQPFRGLRYDPALVGDVGRVLAPPYDVISDAQRDALYHTHEQNVIRLILGKPQAGDANGENVYTRARTTFQDWRTRQILRRDEHPGLYLYEQQFTVGDRRLRRLGFIALLTLDDAAVFRHEQTFQGPKTDRERLLQAVRANLSPIFCLYADGSDGPIHRQLRQLADRATPVIDANVQGEGERLWQITDPAAVAGIQAAMRDKQVIIADGHHRYEVALTNRHLSPSVMAYFGWLEDAAMVVLPIHRLVRMGHALPLPAMEERLRRCMQITSVQEPETLFRMLEAGKDEVGLFGLCACGQYRLLRVQSSEVEAALQRHGAPAAWSNLDVALLHSLLLPYLADGQPLAPAQITYTKDAQEALRWAQDGPDRAAFLLNPVPVARIQEVALQGHRLPQKSTYFYPKLLSGLVINPFD